MALNTSKCNHLTPLRVKGLNGYLDIGIFRVPTVLLYCLLKLVDIKQCYFNCHEGDEATSIPAECCAVPYTLNGELYHSCTVNTAVSNDLGCYNNNAQWVTCLQPQGTFLPHEQLCYRNMQFCPSIRPSVYVLHACFVTKSNNALRIL